MDVQTASELAKLSQQLTQIQMLFVIIVALMILFSLVVIGLFRNAQRDDDMQIETLRLLGKQTESFQKAVELFELQQKDFHSQQKIFWKQSTAEHKAVIATLKGMYIRLVEKVENQ